MGSRSPAGPRRLGTATRISASLFRRLSAFFGSTRPSPKSGKTCRSDTRPGDVCERAERSEGSDTTPPCRNAEKCKPGVLSPPPTGLPPNPSEAVSVGRRRCSGVSEFLSAAATETRDMQLVPPTASIAFVWSAAKPLPCQMHRAGKALHPNSGQKPGPTFSYDWRKT